MITLKDFDFRRIGDFGEEFAELYINGKWFEIYKTKTCSMKISVDGFCISGISKSKAEEMLANFQKHGHPLAEEIEFNGEKIICVPISFAECLFLAKKHHVKIYIPGISRCKIDRYEPDNQTIKLYYAYNDAFGLMQELLIVGGDVERHSDAGFCMSENALDYEEELVSMPVYLNKIDHIDSLSIKDINDDQYDTYIPLGDYNDFVRDSKK